MIHLSSHSFTPELDGKVRKADIGLIYDPARQREGGSVRALEGDSQDLCARS